MAFDMRIVRPAHLYHMPHTLFTRRNDFWYKFQVDKKKQPKQRSKFFRNHAEFILQKKAISYALAPSVSLKTCSMKNVPWWRINHHSVESILRLWWHNQLEWLPLPLWFDYFTPCVHVSLCLTKLPLSLVYVFFCKKKEKQKWD